MNPQRTKKLAYVGIRTPGQKGFKIMSLGNQNEKSLFTFAAEEQNRMRQNLPAPRK